MPAIQLELPQGFVADGRHQITVAALPIHFEDERHVFGCGVTNVIRFGLTFRQFGAGGEPARGRCYVERHLVAELAIVPRNTRDRLNQLTTFGAPTMDHFECRRIETTATVGRVGAHELGQAKPNSMPPYDHVWEIWYSDETMRRVRVSSTIRKS